ncbi:MAG: helicase [Comamonadaceae bacterium CG_4_9_14_0_8_um_filter_57_21]|nr:MAG: helicase [Comamonadaceae bacterium CG_4_9_14_0_8_um_filter_57_21]
MTKKSGNDLFIVDNSDDDWKVLNYLAEWTDISNKFDIATGYFEIGSLLALDGKWQKLDQIRILMGDEVTRRTQRTLNDGVGRIQGLLDDSIEREKLKNDFLTGVAAVVQAIAIGQIKCRVYTKRKFHAKAYVTHSKLSVVGSSALVGSSNFTYPGLTGNVELNVKVDSSSEVAKLQQWYEDHWSQAQDVSAEVLKVIERHTRHYLPFEVYAKALQAYFTNVEESAGDWERKHSRMYSVLDQYQRDGYAALLKIGAKYGGAFLCDGVGLGKTFVGLMLIERLVKFDHKKVLLVVPKSGREPVWESSLRSYLPELFGDFSNLVVINHTDLQRGGEWLEKLQRLKDQADVLVIDEAHHFRNPGTQADTSRYWQMQSLAKGKQVFMLTATPINNSLLDLQHLIEHFTQREPGHFKDTLGIHSLPGHFRKLEKELIKRMGGELVQGELAGFETTDILSQDSLLRELVVQRSRAYVKQSQLTAGAKAAFFPQRAAPKVADYSVKKTYGKLLGLVEKAFNKKQPLFTLPMYYPLAYPNPDADGLAKDDFEENRQKQVVGLIRILFLKRFESSACAFESSCQQLLKKVLAFVQANSISKHELAALERWRIHWEELTDAVQMRQNDMFGGSPEDDAALEEDFISEELLATFEPLDRRLYDVPQILSESLQDLNQLAEFLNELRQFKPSQDNKLQALIKLLKTDPVLKQHKVMIFSEFSATARYLACELVKADIQGVDQIDSGIKRSRSDVIRQFSPYYNGQTSQSLADQGYAETRILIATDVLSEGLNLQDATRLINYDLHWNPVRLMQRIGRVDRRMNPEIEKKLMADHPQVKAIRGTVEYWNFLPPGDLDELLNLFKKVSNKTLLISKTLGIEGKKLLRPEDDFAALVDFNHQFEGEPTALETMHLEYQRLLVAHPDLGARLQALPGRVFSGKAHVQPGTQAVFFCYGLPGIDHSVTAPVVESDAWTLAAGRTAWLLLDLSTGKVLEDAAAIDAVIHCEPTTTRQCQIAPTSLSEARSKIEKHLKNGYLRQVQAPLGVLPQLIGWMELN